MNPDELEVRNINIGRALNKVENGEFRIPQFQREFSWSKQDVVKLFDSIYNNYPVGSLFIWSPKTDDHFREFNAVDQPEPSDIDRKISFVLDGQQRLTSLYYGLNGIETEDYDYNRILFDFETEEFTLGSGKSDNLVSVSDIWGDNMSMFFDQYDADTVEKLNECSNRFKNYELPLIEINTDEFDEVIEVFERINQSGENLSRFDIVHANIWSENFNLRKRIDNDVIEPLEDKGFGTLSREVVAEATSLAIEGKSDTNTQKSLDSEKVSKNWTRIKDSVVNAVNYIMRSYNIQRVEFLPFESLIAILSYYMYQSGEDTVKSSHQDEIDRYFWRVVCSDHWAKARQSTLSSDTQIIDDIIEGRSVDINFTPVINPDKLKNANIKRSKNHERNAFLCILASCEPLSFEDGAPIDLTNGHFTSFRLENHHIFPNNWLRMNGWSKDMRKSVVDITFLPQNINIEIRDQAPSEYFEKYRDREDFDDIMRSHLIPSSDKSAIWDNDYERFLEQRCFAIIDRMKELIGGGVDIEDSSLTPNMLINQSKTAIRDIIHHKLSESHEDGYWDVLPSGVVNSVDEDIDGEVDSLREKLEYISMEEASNIISVHWSIFNDVFPEKEDVEYHLDNLQTYEKSYNNNEEDIYSEIDGELAIQWVKSCAEQVESNKNE